MKNTVTFMVRLCSIQTLTFSDIPLLIVYYVVFLYFNILIIKLNINTIKSGIAVPFTGV